MGMKTPRLLIATAVAGMLAAGIALPASAAPGDTVATLTVAGGSLSITMPATANLGSRTNTLGGGVLDGSLGQMQVVDARSGTAGWVASAISTTFAKSGATAIAAGSVSYTAGTITTVGTATYTANNPISLAPVSPVVTATAVSGDNSATWTPMIHVIIPGGATVGDYTATITHSVV
jgi:hypothetical protein